MLGKRIAALRRDARLSQKKLAEALCISPSAVGMYEQGRRIPDAALLVAIATLFGVSTDYLLVGAERDVLARRLRERTVGENGAPPDEAIAALLADGFSDLTASVKSAMMEENGGACHMTDEQWMQEALALAQEAAAEGEVPVGCVVVADGRVVGRGRNRREQAKNALAHAELEAINEACRTLGGWRLWMCTLYVTLEPCPMCAGAIINARVPRVVFGASDPKAGSCGSLTDLFALPYNHKPEVTSGVCAEEARAQLRDFFRKLRENPVVKTWSGKR